MILTAETDRTYLVLPPWCTYPFSWTELPDILSNPTANEYFMTNFDWKAHGYNESIQPSELISGAFGNGIIRVHANLTDRWLPWLVLSRVGNFVRPVALEQFNSQLDFCVGYLEPFAIQKSFDKCPITCEHFEDSDGVYWVFGVASPAAVPSDFAKTVVTIGSTFNMSVQLCLDALPIQRSTKDWFAGSNAHFIWFKVESQQLLIGYQFAMFMYTALALQTKVRLVYAHLLSAISGEPSVRPKMKHW